MALLINCSNLVLLLLFGHHYQHYYYVIVPPPIWLVNSAIWTFWVILLQNGAGSISCISIILNNIIIVVLHSDLLPILIAINLIILIYLLNSQIHSSLSTSSWIAGFRVCLIPCSKHHSFVLCCSFGSVLFTESDRFVSWSNVTF